MEGKHWVIGDVHGCGKTLEGLLKQVQPSQADRITFLGDILDRGNTHKHLFDVLFELMQGTKVDILRGNHEQAFLDALDEIPQKNWLGKERRPLLENWKKFGGDRLLLEFNLKYAQDLPPNIGEMVRESKYFMECDEAFLVHAGFNFAHPNPFEDFQSMMWIREFEIDWKQTKGKRVVHGHVPVSIELVEQCLKHPEYGFLDLDNGCIYRGQPGMGNLLALDLHSNTLLVQPNIEPYYL